MKSIRLNMLLSAAIAVVVTAASCSKIESSTETPESEGTVELCITGDFNDFGTKAEIENIFRMTWAEGTGDPKVYDKVYVYGKASGADVFSCLGTLDAMPDASTGNRVADLNGTITAPKANTKLTLVYSPVLTSTPEVNSGAISIDLSSQSGGANDVTFVAYATVDYKGATDATYCTSFKFATSVLRVNVGCITASAALTESILCGIESNCKLAFNETAVPTVTGEKNSYGTITREFTDCSSNAKGTAAFYLAVPAITANAGRELLVTQGDKEYCNIGFATGAKAGGSMMNSIAVMENAKGVLNGQDYVLIAAQYDGTNYSYLKWATENLAVTESGQKEWNNTGHRIGDYFQWAASYGGYGLDGSSGKDTILTNLVIYDYFTINEGWDGGSFHFDKSKIFYYQHAPYINTKYIKTDSYRVLEPSDDVASIVLGSTWRIATGSYGGEWEDLLKSTYWAWDATDKGYYVFRPGVGTDGEAGKCSTSGKTYNKTKALLFFPACGYGKENGFGDGSVGKVGDYWSSTTDPSMGSYQRFAFRMTINASNTQPVAESGWQYSYRDYGNLIRPVSN